SPRAVSISSLRFSIRRRNGAALPSRELRAARAGRCAFCFAMGRLPCVVCSRSARSVALAGPARVEPIVHFLIGLDGKVLAALDVAKITRVVDSGFADRGESLARHCGKTPRTIDERATDFRLGRVGQTLFLTGHEAGR